MKRPELNRSLVLEDIVRAPDGSGGFLGTWTPLGVIWAEVRALGGRETDSDHAKLSKVGYEITMRSAPAGAPSRPKPEQRFVEGTRVFRILSVNEKDIGGQYLSCTCAEEVAS